MISTTGDNFDESAERRYEKLGRELGETVNAGLANPDVIEIMLNPDGRIWFDTLSRGMFDTKRTMRATQADGLLRSVATLLDTSITEDHPILEGELPFNGSRFQGIRAPVVRSPIFAIRKPASLVFTFDDYAKQTTGARIADAPENQLALNGRDHSRSRLPDLLEVTRQATIDHKNILVVGGTGSGKTTYINAIIAEMALNKSERIAIIEDARELQCQADNYFDLRTTDMVKMSSLLRASLRLRPDRIIIGEVRDHTALDFVMALNTGHSGGACSVHANNALAGLQRLEVLCGMSDHAPPQHLIARMIAESIDLVVFIQRTDYGTREPREAIWLTGWDVQNQCYTFEQVKNISTSSVGVMVAS